MSDSLWPHGLPHARLPWLSLSTGVCLNSCPLNWWCHPTISSFVTSFSSCLQSFPASGSFPMSQFFASGGQSIGASASASVLQMNNQDWFPLRLTGLIALLSKGLSRVFSSRQFKSISSLVLSIPFGPTLSSPYMTTGKTIDLTIWTFVCKMMSLLFNRLCRFFISVWMLSKGLQVVFYLSGRFSKVNKWIQIRYLSNYCLYTGAWIKWILYVLFKSTVTVFHSPPALFLYIGPAGLQSQMF